MTTVLTCLVQSPCDPMHESEEKLLRGLVGPLPNTVDLTCEEEYVGKAQYMLEWLGTVAPLAKGDWHS